MEMFDFNLWLDGLMVLLVFAAAGWLLSLPLRNVSIVDIMWSLMFLLASITYAMAHVAPGPRAWLVIGLVSLWSIRLAAFIGWRNFGKDEDFRYQKIRANNQPGFAVKSVYLVFGLQAGLAWVISLPLLAAINSTAPLSWMDALGVMLWLTGLIFEAGGDWQLSRFKRDSANRGKVLNTGLWRYTRHPNYFGDFCVWWGFFLIALSSGAWWSVVGPLVMSILLLKVSGVALLEKDIADRRPDYNAYIQRTNAFFPGPPRAP
jgi:steroid 5-alpha reductase family enzyme